MEEDERLSGVTTTVLSLEVFVDEEFFVELDSTAGELGTSVIVSLVVDPSVVETAGIVVLVVSVVLPSPTKTDHKRDKNPPLGGGRFAVATVPEVSLTAAGDDSFSAVFAVIALLFTEEEIETDDSACELTLEEEIGVSVSLLLLLVAVVLVVVTTDPLFVSLFAIFFELWLLFDVCCWTVISVVVEPLLLALSISSCIPKKSANVSTNSLRTAFLTVSGGGVVVLLLLFVLLLLCCCCWVR